MYEQKFLKTLYKKVAQKLNKNFVQSDEKFFW
jgi:hypothetical protein